MNKIGLGVKQDSLVEDFVNTDAVHNTRNVLKKIVLWSIGIELMGSVILISIVGKRRLSKRDQVFSSIFHSVSAFNNAGLSFFEGGLYNELVRDNYLVHLVITILVFFGALGFVAIFNLFDPKSLRERIKYP